MERGAGPLVGPRGTWAARGGPAGGFGSGVCWCRFRCRPTAGPVQDVGGQGAPHGAGPPAPDSVV